MLKPVSKRAIYEAAEALSNWGRWGEDDQMGTINHITPADIVAAAGLIRQGKIFSLGLSLKEKIQSGLFGMRWNPVHQMLATGTDALAGNQTSPNIQYADDSISMPCQGSTQWDALCHVFLDGKMYNGYSAALVDSQGGKKLGIEHMRNKMVGRGVLLDIPRWKGIDWLEDGYGITSGDLDDCAKAQGVEIRKGDFVIVRTGHQERCISHGSWVGYAGGDAPGLAFETAYWIHEKEIAAICADTWGCEVRPNETEEAYQPWHWVVIPAIGISMGEIFYVKELAEDCAADKVYEFFFVAPPLHLPGGAGSPVNPQAIK
ncbi:MAG: cyclase family protein [Mesorhizobium sp.]|nr:MAG: cyclase family protein [Mesorhizobium sp.]